MWPDPNVGALSLGVAALILQANAPARKQGLAMRENIRPSIQLTVFVLRCLQESRRQSGCIKRSLALVWRSQPGTSGYASRTSLAWSEHYFLFLCVFLRVSHFAHKGKKRSG